MTNVGKFQVIRFMISLAHFDGVISADEKKAISEKLYKKSL